MIPANLPLIGSLALRQTRPDDTDFLLKMFMAARPWLTETSHDADFVRTLFEDQYRITRHGLETLYPEHLDFVVEKTGQSVGHLTINLGRDDWRLGIVEIHPRARRKGIGRDLVKSLQTAAGSKLISLSVMAMTFPNDGLLFWLSQGFRVVDQRPPAVGLLWYPPGRPWPQLPAAG